MQIITIIGGGSSTHTLIPFLTNNNRKINLLTRNPNKWDTEINLEWRNANDEVIREFQGKLNYATDQAEMVIPKSDIIIFCMPVYKYYDILEEIGKHISKNTVIGTIYGQGGFNFMVDDIKLKYNLSNITTFAVGLIPWICRIKEYGKTGITYGSKHLNIVAFDNKNKYEELEELFYDMCYKWFKKGSFVLADNFISLTLSVDNQIIHTARLYGLFKKFGGSWKFLDEVPYFYRDFDDLSAKYLKELDDDYSLIRNKIKESYPNQNFEFMLDYLKLEQLTYNSVNTNIKESFVSSETLGAIKTPVVEKNGKWIINKNHRFFYDDIYYGLCIAKLLAERLDLKVNMIDNILKWAEELLDESILKDNKLVINEKIALLDKYKCKTFNDIVK